MFCVGNKCLNGLRHLLSSIFAHPYVLVTGRFTSTVFVVCLFQTEADVLLHDGSFEIPPRQPGLHNGSRQL
jgi:hypothetical protein